VKEMDKLDIIIQKLESLETRMTSIETRMTSIETKMTSIETRMTSIESGQKELYAIVSSIQHRQEETDAKLDSLAMDVNKLYGKVEGLYSQFAEFREETRNNINRLDRHDRAIEQDLDRTIERLDDHIANRI
jgi:chromosome segregation ATPase